MQRCPLKLASLLGLALVMSFFVPQRAWADDDDPPSRVARLSYTHGPVSFQPAGTDDWVSAVVNRPITTGDKLWADNDSRAELHIGSASIRISGNTGFSFLNLTDDTVQIQLTSGTLRVRVKRLGDGENFEIDTPNLAFSVLRPGVYRIHVNDDGDSTVIRVGSGEGEVTGGGSAYTVHAREVGTFNGNDQLIADFENYRDDQDDFDAWCADRERSEDFSASRRYVSDDVIGYEDLDEHGGWRPVPEYGNVWFPHTTIVGWAPYRYGHWVYIHPWGYTWVDDAPWGFAPFHYGRWINYNGVWGWVPCPPRAPNVVYVRPVYAPALVAWVGGPHFGVGLSVGWFPLAPREVYVPSYRVSRAYINNVNVSNTTVNTTVINNYYNTTVINRNTTVVNNNVTEIHQTYVNQSVPGAVTATTHQAFTSAQPVAKNAVAMNAKEAAGAPVSAFTPPVPPVKQGVLGSGAVATAKPPVAQQNRAVVAKVQPPPPPVPFVKQQQAIQANGGKPLGIAQEHQIQAQTPAPAQHLVKIAPTPTNVQGNRPGPGQNAGGNPPGGQPSNAGNKPGAPNNAGSGNPTGQPPARGINQPGTPINAGQQGGSKPNNPPVNNPSNAAGGNPNANQGGNQKNYNDRPPVSRPPGGASPSSNVNPQLEQQQLQERQRLAQKAADDQRQQQLNQKHQQELEQLRAKQDQERQRAEQQQLQERQRLAQKAADDQRQQQLNQKHQQELESLEKKHDNQQQQLQQKQQAERNKPAPPSKPDKEKDKEKKDHP
jgi:hypothetical protein